MAKKSAKEMMDALIEKRKELHGTDKPQYKTNIFKPSVFSDRGSFDVKSAGKEQLLNGMKSMMNHDAACKELGMDATHLGFTADEWKEDFKLRMRVLKRNETLADIEKYSAALRPLLTRSELRDLGITELSEGIEAVLKSE